MGMASSRSMLYPQNIVVKRGNNRSIAIAAVAGGWLLFGSVFASDGRLFYLINSSAAVVVLLGISEIMTRWCSLPEEFKHIASRYDSKLGTLVMEVFSFSRQSATLFVLALFVVLFIYFTFGECPFIIMFSGHWGSVGSAMFCMELLRRVVKLEEGPLNDSIQIHELNGLDYGSGMAHSFYHGYLRIVLPHSGRAQDKGLKEFQQDYESRHNIAFDVYKLFILLPLSLHCPPSLDSPFSPSVESSKELESIEVDRAGVKNRNYKNSVYKINTENNKKKYVTAEYATPLKTLFEVIKTNTAAAQLYYKHRKEILLNFYLTLVDLLKNDPELCDLCEVIYYDDKDENGEYLDVGQILLNRIKQIVKKQK